LKIVEDAEFRAGLLKKIADREFSERTGVHCSDLIYCLNKQAIRRLHPEPSEDSETLLFSLGWATQRWLTGKDEDEESRVVDGIIVTCDAVIETCPWELKASYQSSNKDISENLAWVRQIMAQCYVLESTTAYLSRLEIMGDWKSVFKPKDYKLWNAEEKLVFDKEHSKPALHAYKLEFTREELDKNWEWLKERRDMFQELLDGAPLFPRLAALAPGMAWLCGYCKYKCGDLAV